jgi:hypothetical protein
MVAWTWDWERPDRVLRWIGMVCLTMVFGILILPIGFDPNEKAWATRIGVGTASLFFAFGLGQLVLTPPYLGTDEPSHFFSYQRWMKDTKTVNAGLAEGRRLHSGRLLLRPEQKLSGMDRTAPWWWFLDNPVTIDTRPAARSATTARLWTQSRPWFEDRTAFSMLFRLRFLSLLTFSVGIGLGAALLVKVVPRDEWSPWLGWTPLLIPSLPYFGMNYSNYPTLFGGFVVLGAAMATSLVTPGRPWWLGGILGVATGFVLHTSQSAIPAIAFVALGLGVIASGRLFRPEAVLGPNRPSWGFWLFLGLGLMSARIFSTPEFETETQMRLVQARERLRDLTTFVGYFEVVVGIVVGGCLVESLAIWCRGKVSTWIGAKLGLLGYGFAVLLAAGLVYNMSHSAPRLDALQEVVPSWEYVPNQKILLPSVNEAVPKTPTPRVKDYDLSAVRAVVGSLGPGDHDFMASRLFWTLGGYLDCLAPDGWISLFSTLFTVGLLLLAWDIGRHRDGERIWILFGLLAGLGIYLVLMATASVTATAKPSLHGRYLIGFYLCFLTIGMVGLRSWLAKGSARRPMLMAVVALGLPVAHQLSLIATQLDRYYS